MKQSTGFNAATGTSSEGFSRGTIDLQATNIKQLIQMP